MKILLTGFVPFSGSALSPSQTLVEPAPKTLFGKADLVQAALPDALEDHQPDAPLCFGLALEEQALALLVQALIRK